jgi:hypothetical protein
MTNPHPAVVMTVNAKCNLCGAAAVVQWRRRLTATELAAYDAKVQAERTRLTAISDPANPPVFGPLPTSDDVAIAVYACVQHAVSLQSASLVHAAICTAPNAANLPNCDCTPETAPPPDPTPTPTLPTGW